MFLGVTLLTGCTASEWPEAKPGLYNWYESDASADVVQKRYESASQKPLGTKADILKIDKVILNNREHVCSKVRELRWLNSTHVMAKAGIYGPNLGSSEYTFVLEKKGEDWKVIACYMDWIS